MGGWKTDDHLGLIYKEDFLKFPLHNYPRPWDSAHLFLVTPLLLQCFCLSELTPLPVPTPTPFIQVCLQQTSRALGSGTAPLVEKLDVPAPPHQLLIATSALSSCWMCKWNEQSRSCFTLVLLYVLTLLLISEGWVENTEKKRTSFSGRDLIVKFSELNHVATGEEVKADKCLC